MKNQLNIVFGIALISLLSIGCKKDSKQPSPEPAKFTVSSTSFKDGVADHKLLWGLKSPHVSWENAPAGAKIFLITVKDNVPDLKQQHTYWTSVVALGVELKEQRISRDPKEWSVSDFNIPQKDNGATECILEITALKAIDLGAKVKMRSSDVLGVTWVKYKIVK